MRRIPMRMEDWIKKLNGFLQLNDRDILDHTGKVSHELAIQHANDKYMKFHKQRLQIEAEQTDNQDFDVLVKQVTDKNKEQNK